jgi:sortase (surface protein transpeptidase)
VQQVGEPQTLIIPSLGLQAYVENVAKTPNGAMDVPSRSEDVAWYRLGPRPGEPGNAVIAGHLDTDKGPAIFEKLHTLVPGDAIEVRDDAGITRHFRVTRTVTYDLDTAPITEIFGKADGIYLNLITCGGKWNEQRKRYEERVVVYTEVI